MHFGIKAREAAIQRPQVFLKNITFNDGTVLSLKQNSIVVFTGANNSGKSQVLKDIERDLDGGNQFAKVVISSTEYGYSGTLDEEVFFNENFFRNHAGYYQSYDSGSSFSKTTIRSYWKNRTFHDGFHKIFVKLLSTESRLTASNALHRASRPESHPIFKLHESEDLTRKLSDYFHEAFGIDLVVNRGEMTVIPLHVGQAPDASKFTMEQRDCYEAQVAKMPKLQDQGDGMRSFASILLDTFTSDHTITLIDEPDAFLHPPQARILGKMLAKNNPEQRQLFISTHSEGFLQGLLDADSNNVTVIRIHRDENINRMSVLKNNEIKKLWGSALLRYSNILSGLFHEKVVVCESDYDCLFYEAMIDAMCESKNEIAPDILFTHCGGKNRIKDVVGALKAVNVPVVAIYDFDLIKEKPTFKSTFEAFGSAWNNELEASTKVIYDGVNSRNGSKRGAWEQLKSTGKAGLIVDEPAAYEKVEAICMSLGLFIVPVGEMECFDKTVNKKQKNWVYYVLENYDLATEPKLAGARDFVQAVVDYMPNYCV